MKRKLIVITLAVMMLASLVACGGKKSVLEKFEDELKSKGLKYETVQMAAAMIGAKEGVKFLIGEGRVELYVFDKSSEAYKEFERTQTMTLAGIASFPAVVAGGAAMIVDGLDQATYEEIFRRIIE